MNTPIPSPVIKLGVKGRFKLEVRKAGERDSRVVAEFDNLITNRGLDVLAGSVDSWDNACAVGTGSVTPSTSDTKLDSFRAIVNKTSTTSFSSSGSPNYNITRTTVYNFDQGAASGNLTEVGIANYNNSTSYLLNSRALILDEFGNPTTITVLSDEFLTVTYQLILVPTLTDVTQTVGSYTFTIRVSNIQNVDSGGSSTSWSCGPIGQMTNTAYFTAFSGVIQSITSGPSGTQMMSSSINNLTYTTGTYYRDFSAQWQPDTGSLDINSFRFALTGPVYQIGVSPAIPKTSNDVMNISVRVAVNRI